MAIFAFQNKRYLKRLLVFLSFSLLAAVGYFVYDNWTKDADLSIWSFVPTSSIAVYETDSPILSLTEIQKTEIYQNLSSLPFIGNLEDGVSTLDSLAGKGNFSAFFDQNPILLCLNSISSQELDLLYVVEIKNLSQQTYISKAQGYFLKNGYNKRTREYLGFTITELFHPSHPKTAFTYIYYHNYFVGSFSAFLVEDAIRTVSQDHTQSFEQAFPELNQLSKLAKDDGNLYINQHRLNTLTNTFTTQETKVSLASSSFLDVDFQKNKLTLSGFSFTDDPSQWLHNLKNLPAGGIDLLEMVPGHTAWMYHISTTSPAQLGKNLKKYFTAYEPDVQATKKLIKEEVDFDIDYTYNLIDEEMGLINLESVNGIYDQLLILEIADMGEALKFFNSAGERHMAQTQDSIHVETYGNYQIRSLPVSDFVYGLLGKMAKKQSDCFYLQYRNYLVFSNNLAQLKKLIVAIESEDTWIKGVQHSEFLQLLDPGANYSLFVHTPLLWDHFKNSFKPRWQAYAQTHQRTFKYLEYLAVQYTQIDDKFYTSFNLFQPKLPDLSIPENIQIDKSVTFSSPIISKPWVVTNHNDQSKEIIIQDTSHNLYLVGPDKTVLWDYQADGQILSKLWQIDYYRNGKLQYLFATQNKVYIIDRTGADLPGFPKSVGNGIAIQGFNVIDYDNSKNYRFAITDKEKHIWLTDKNANALNGWDPLEYRGHLVQAPIHKRISAKDYLITVTTEGQISLLNRRGNAYPNYPIDLKSQIDSPVFVKEGNDLSNSLIYIITKQGQLIVLNFLGQTIRREQLYKPGANTQFEFIADVSEEDVLILRKTGSRHEILNINGLNLFEKDYFTNEPLSIQYFRLGSGTELLTFVESSASNLYIYDRNGVLQTGRPLSASGPIAVLRYGNSYEVYKPVGAQLDILSLSIQ